MAVYDIAANQVLAQPVTAYYKGRALRRAEQAEEAEIAHRRAATEQTELENERLRNPPVDRAKQLETARSALTLLRDFEAQTLTGYRAKLEAGEAKEAARAWAQQDFEQKRQMAANLGLYQVLGLNPRLDERLEWEEAASIAAISDSASALERLKPKEPKLPPSREVKRRDPKTGAEIIETEEIGPDGEVRTIGTAARFEPDGGKGGDGEGKFKFTAADAGRFSGDAARAFGGIYNPVTGEIGGLDPEQAKQAASIAAEAARVYRENRGALSHNEAFNEALARSRAEDKTPEARKTVGGKNYVKIGGKWYEE